MSVLNALLDYTEVREQEFTETTEFWGAGATVNHAVKELQTTRVSFAVDDYDPDALPLRVSYRKDGLSLVARLHCFANGVATYNVEED